jgi:hypothetical protein
MSLTVVDGGLLSPTNGQFYSMKNRIINGAMVIDQRNAGASVTPTNGLYTLDRFAYFATQASKFTCQQTPSATETGYATRVAAGFTNYMAWTVASAVTVGVSDTFYFKQAIEGFNFSDMAWGTSNAKTITLSFLAYSSLTGTFGGSLFNSAGTRSYPFSYSIPTANTWTQISVIIAGDTSGTWLTTNGIGVNVVWGLGSGSTYTATAGAWTAGTFVQPTSTVSVVGTASATFYITGVQLEKGSTATSFDYRPYGTELALCQRYLPAFRYDTSNTIIPSQLQFNSTTAGRGMIVFPVPTRTTVTGATISSAAHFTCFDSAGTNTVASAMAISTGGTNGTLFDANVASGGTTNRSYTLGITNSAGYIYFTGAEL